jgi:nucleoside-diphosphate-sugar epimerase
MTYATTGAHGYIGSRMVAYLRRLGHRVVELTRRPGAAGGDTVVFSLEHGGDFNRLRGIDTLIHCAYDFRARSWPEIEARNVAGSVRLFDAAVDAGVRRIIQISSMAAFPGCRSMYGRAKLMIEREAAARGGSVIRPGLVFGPDAGGVTGALVLAATRLPIVPIPAGGDQRLFLTHDADLCRLVTVIAHTEHLEPGAPILAAATRPWTLREIIETIARARGRSPVFLPIPWRAVWGGLKAGELLHLPMPFRSDSMVSLVTQDPAPSFESLERLDVGFRDFTPDALVASTPASR